MSRIETEENKDLQLDEKVSRKCSQAIVLSGIARSGTTLMGRILHSMKDVEYGFEPPILFSLFALISRLSAPTWKLLYETYLYEELLMNAIAGRGLNCNLMDDSSVYRVKPETLVKRRLETSLGKRDAEQLAKQSVIAYKIPDVTFVLPTFQSYYPETKIVIMARKASPVLRSVMKKGWYSDEALRNENLVWPNRYHDGMRVPFWVAPEDTAEWCAFDELNRIGYYYARMHEAIEHVQGAYLVKYNALVTKPEDTVRAFAAHLELQCGEKTEALIGSIRVKEAECDDSILDGLRPEIRTKVAFYSSSA